MCWTPVAWGWLAGLASVTGGGRVPASLGWEGGGGCAGGVGGVY